METRADSEEENGYVRPLSADASRASCSVPLTKPWSQSSLARIASSSISTTWGIAHTVSFARRSSEINLLCHFSTCRGGSVTATPMIRPPHKHALRLPSYPDISSKCRSLLLHSFGPHQRRIISFAVRPYPLFRYEDNHRIRHVGNFILVRFIISYLCLHTYILL